MKKAALVLGLVGCLLLALNTGLTLVAYLFMLTSSGLWIWTLRRSEREAMLLNVGFALINLVGIWRAL
jgi:hypothetical protein